MILDPPCRRVARRPGKSCVMLLLPALLGWSAAQATCVPQAGFPAPIAPDERYTVTEPDPGNHAGDRVVLDSATGLVWKQCFEGLSGATCETGEIAGGPWASALALANASTHAGFSDWRLPTTTELVSLFETSCAPAINEQIFPNYGGSFVWTSVSSTGVPDVNGPENAWVVNFFEGSVFQNLKTDDADAILVRGGNGFAEFASDADYVPDAFAFPAQNDVALATPIASAAVAITGLTTVTGIRIGGEAGSSYSINGLPFTTLPGSLRDGDTVTVMHTSASGDTLSVSSLVTIGGVTAEFVSTTGDQNNVFADGFE